jgi:hypothetical protein
MRRERLLRSAKNDVDRDDSFVPTSTIALLADGIEHLIFQMP